MNGDELDLPGASDRHRDAAIDTLSKVMAYDPYFPKPAESVVQAWAELIAEHDIELGYLLRAVTIVYRDNSDPKFRVTPGLVCKTAREVRRQHHDSALDRLSENAKKITLSEFKAANPGVWPDGVRIGKSVPDAPSEA